MIEKTSGGFKVISERTGRSLGSYPTKGQALRRLRQVEYWKKARAKFNRGKTSKG